MAKAKWKSSPSPLQLHLFRLAVHSDEAHIRAPIDSSLVSETQRPSAMQDFVLWVLMFCWKINGINNEPWGKCQVLAFLNITPSFR